MTETVETEAVPAKVKEPRVTIARDEKVLAYVAESGDEGRLREDVLAFLRGDEPDLSASQAYLTLNRLKAAGKVARVFKAGKHRWTAA